MPRVKFSLGVSPENASSYSEEIEQRIVDNATQKDVCAIGSCGLDTTYDEAQVEAFRRQIRLAHRLELPLIVKATGALAQARAVLVEEGVPEKGVLLRAFGADAVSAHGAGSNMGNGEDGGQSGAEDSGKVGAGIVEGGCEGAGKSADEDAGESAKRAEFETLADELSAWCELGSYISFDAHAANDPVTFAELARMVPLDRLMVESGATTSGVNELSGFDSRCDQVVFVADALLGVVTSSQLARNHQILFGF